MMLRPGSRRPRKRDTVAMATGLNFTDPGETSGILKATFRDARGHRCDNRRALIHNPPVPASTSAGARRAVPTRHTDPSAALIHGPGLPWTTLRKAGPSAH